MVDRPFHRAEWLTKDVLDPVVRRPPQAQSLPGDIALRPCGLVSVIEADMAVDVQHTGEICCGFQPISGEETGPSFRSVVAAQTGPLTSQPTDFGNAVQPQ